MSSIFGIINFDNRPVCEGTIRALLLKMNAGANDCAMHWVKDNAGFGHSTFWTTPESQLEKQPLSTDDGTLILVADARIDNRNDLIAELAIRSTNISNRVTTDAELILQAYRKWSEQCVNHLLGDYSFVIYARNHQRLFIARDHLGFRPLYYLRTGNTFVFCSEIQPILNLGIVSRELNMEAFDYSLLFDAIPSGSTYFKHISRFEGGTTSWIDARGINTRRYWKPEDYEIRDSLSVDDAAGEFIEIFEKAVSARLRSAYPVGIELSGGLDSSSVTMMADKIGVEQDWYPLALRFGNLDCDEGQYIDAISNRLKRQPLVLRVDQLDFSSVHKLSDYYAAKCDWPADLFFLPHIILAQMASEKGVRVMLTGQGGDEVMQGSRWINHDYLRKLKLASLVSEIANGGHKIHDIENYLLRPLLPDAVTELLRLIKDCFRGKAIVPALQKKRIMVGEMLFDDKAFKLKSSWDTARMLNRLEATLWRDNNPYLLNSQNKIDVRHPFFDIRLVAFRLTTPANFFYRHGQYKVLLRKAMQDLLPELVRNRQDKAVFGDIIKRQLTSEKYDAIAIQDRFENLISAKIWNHLPRLHAKHDFDDHQRFLEWKLINVYAWLNASEIV